MASEQGVWRLYGGISTGGVALVRGDMVASARRGGGGSVSTPYGATPFLVQYALITKSHQLELKKSGDREILTILGPHTKGLPLAKKSYLPICQEICHQPNPAISARTTHLPSATSALSARTNTICHFHLICQDNYHLQISPHLPEQLTSATSAISARTYTICHFHLISQNNYHLLLPPYLTEHVP